MREIHGSYVISIGNIRIVCFSQIKIDFTRELGGFMSHKKITNINFLWFGFLLVIWMELG